MCMLAKKCFLKFYERILYLVQSLNNYATIAILLFVFMLIGLGMHLDFVNIVF